MGARVPVLGDLCEGRDNNLNLIRMVAATSVLVSHAWPISLGSGSWEPLSETLGWSLGGVAVLVFFSISGFLIARSFERQSTARWVLARVLRLVPALLVVLVLTAWLLGPLVTTWALPAYFSNGFTYTYVPRNLLLYNQQGQLPGVFEGNPLPKATNGPLWTLYYEVCWYLVVLVLGLAGALTRRTWLAAALALFAVGYAVVALALGDAAVADKTRWFFLLGLPFATGIGFYAWRDRLPMSPAILAVLALAAVVAHRTPVFDVLFGLALSYAVFLLAFAVGGGLRAYNRVGDFSYGMYIYGFPVQQLMVHFFGPMRPPVNVALALPLALGFAMLSWFLIERPALTMVRWSPEEFGAALGRLRQLAAHDAPAGPPEPPAA